MRILRLPQINQIFPLLLYSYLIVVTTDRIPTVSALVYSLGHHQSSGLYFVAYKEITAAVADFNAHELTIVKSGVPVTAAS